MMTTNQQNVALIFDFDGTIAHTFEHDISKSYNEIAEKMNLPKITQAQFEKLREMNLFDAIKKMKIPLWKLFILQNAMRKKIYRDYDIKIYEGMPEILKQFAIF
jgi:beta-phosphoglucomutase-like phosphatase (HAD superfamily)